MRIRDAFPWTTIVFLGVSCASAAGLLRMPEGSPPQSAGMQNKVFARVVSGSGWDTMVVITNLGPVPVSFQQFFFGRDGNAATFTLRVQNASGDLTTSALQGTVGANASTSFTVSDPGDSVHEGWSVLTFDGSQGRLGAYAVLRRRTPRGDLTEATVPLSDMQDFSVRMPFDNTSGFHSQLTVVNPASNLAAQVSLTYFDSQGRVILMDLLQLQAGEQVTIDVPNTYPDLANQAGTVAVDANTNRLSVAGIRYSASTGALSELLTMASGQNRNLQ